MKISTVFYFILFFRLHSTATAQQNRSSSFCVSMAVQLGHVRLLTRLSLSVSVLLLRTPCAAKSGGYGVKSPQVWQLMPTKRRTFIFNAN